MRRGEMSGAAPPSKQSQIKQCHPPERHLVPRAPRGALPPGSPLAPMRNLMQTHFDHGFGASLDLPTEKMLKNTQKSTPPPPPKKKKKKAVANSQPFVTLGALGGRFSKTEP